MANLGDLKRLDPRSIWPKEALDFTPWLANNLSKLGEALGLELELLEREAAVGRFSADLVAKDLGRGRTVVIENQLEPTDHAHLGQLITYAAGREAGVVVWVSKEFQEPHRQVIDWLNKGKSGLDAEFFGVVVELLQVDDSKPAVNFRCVAFPNDWSRRSVTASTGETTPMQEAYRRFFQRLVDELREKHKFTNARAVQGQGWYQFSSGCSGFRYAASFALQKKIRAELYIDVGDSDKNQEMLESLRKRSSDLEKSFGTKLEWEDLEQKRACRVACYRDGSIQDPQSKLDEYQAWFVDRLLTFKRIFGPILPELNP